MANLFEKNDSKLARAADDIAGNMLGCLIDLYQTPVPLNEDTALIDLQNVVADYTGYAQGLLTWQDPSIADDGEVECIGTCPVFRPTGTAVQNEIVGCFLTSDPAGGLLYFGPLDGQPISMHSATDSITVVVRYRPGTQSLTITIS